MATIESDSPVHLPSSHFSILFSSSVPGSEAEEGMTRRGVWHADLWWVRGPRTQTVCFIAPFTAISKEKLTTLDRWCVCVCVCVFVCVCSYSGALESELRPPFSGRPWFGSLVCTRVWMSFRLIKTDQTAQVWKHPKIGSWVLWST